MHCAIDKQKTLQLSTQKRFRVMSKLVVPVRVIHGCAAKILHLLTPVLCLSELSELITSAKDVMFSSAIVCLFVC